MMDFKLFGNVLLILPRLIASNNCFSKIIADVFLPWHCVNTHLRAADQQTSKTSAFIEVMTLGDDQSIVSAVD